MTTYIYTYPYHRIHWLFRFLTPHQKFVACCKFYAKEHCEKSVISPVVILRRLFAGGSFDEIYYDFYSHLTIYVMGGWPNYIPDLRIFFAERVTSYPAHWKTLKPTKRQLRLYSKFKPLLDKLSDFYPTKDQINSAKNQDVRDYEDEAFDAPRVLKKALKIAYKLSWSLYCDMRKLEYKILLDDMLSKEKDWMNGENLAYDLPIRYEDDEEAEKQHRCNEGTLFDEPYGKMMREIYG